MGAPAPSNKSAAFTSGRNIKQSKPGEDYKKEREAKKKASAGGGGMVVWGSRKKYDPEAAREKRKKKMAEISATAERLKAQRSPMPTMGGRK